MKRFLRGGNPQLAVLTAFFINGAMMATWVARIPAIQARLALREGALGLTLMGLSMGVLLTLSLAGGLLARYGSRALTLWGCILMVLTLPLLALAPNTIVLFFCLTAFGAGLSGMDVAMNEQAVFVERQQRRPLMSSFHAVYSVGNLAGALLAAGMAAISGMATFFHFCLAALFFGSTMIFAYPYLLQTQYEGATRTLSFRLPERALWMLGAIAACSGIGESGMSGWSALFLSGVLRTSAAFAALGYAAFSLTMMIGRFLGDAIVSRWKPARIVAVSGALAAAGFLVVALTSNPLAAVAGFALVGAGLSNVIPLAFSAAGNMPGISPGTGIAGVAALAYSGSLIAPPLIGNVAQATSLRVAFSIIMVLLASMVLTARGMPESKKATE